MVAKIKTHIYVEVEDRDAGEAACASIQAGLLGQMRGFPHGEVIGVDVDSFDEAPQSELKEMGLVE